MYRYAVWQQIPRDEKPTVEWMVEHTLVLHDFGHITLYIDEPARTIYRYTLENDRWFEASF